MPEIEKKSKTPCSPYSIESEIYLETLADRLYAGELPELMGLPTAVYQPYSESAQTAEQAAADSMATGEWDHLFVNPANKLKRL